MAWEIDSQRRTLFIEEFRRNGKKFYTIYPMTRITTKTGTSYVEPIPFDFHMQQKDLVRFDEIQFIDEQGLARTGGDVALNAVVVRDGVRRGA